MVVRLLVPFSFNAAGEGSHYRNSCDCVAVTHHRGAHRCGQKSAEVASWSLAETSLSLAATADKRSTENWQSEDDDDFDSTSQDPTENEEEGLTSAEPLGSEPDAASDSNEYIKDSLKDRAENHNRGTVWTVQTLLHEEVLMPFWLMAPSFAFKIAISISVMGVGINTDEKVDMQKKIGSSPGATVGSLVLILLALNTWRCDLEKLLEIIRGTRDTKEILMAAALIWACSANLEVSISIGLAVLMFGPIQLLRTEPKYKPNLGRFPIHPFQAEWLPRHRYIFIILLPYFLPFWFLRWTPLPALEKHTKSSDRARVEVEERRKELLETIPENMPSFTISGMVFGCFALWYAIRVFPLFWGFFGYGTLSLCTLTFWTWATENAKRCWLDRAWPLGMFFFIVLTNKLVVIFGPQLFVFLSAKFGGSFDAFVLVADRQTPCRARDV